MRAHTDRQSRGTGTAARDEAEPSHSRAPSQTAADRILDLQTKAGNQAVGALLARRRQDSRAGPALHRAPTQVRRSYTVARTTGLAPYAGGASYEVDLSSFECLLTIKVRLVRDSGVTAAQADAVKRETEAQFMRFWDNRFYFEDAANGDRFFLRMRVLWVNSGGHVRVRLSSGSGRDTKTRWFVDGDPLDRAHEMTHVLGIRDEYVDPTTISRRTATSPGVHRDHSLMGNYYDEGQANAEVKLRHGQIVADDVGRSVRPRRRLTAHFTGTAQGERLVHWRGIRDRAIAGGDAAEQRAAEAEITSIRSDMLIPRNVRDPNDW